MGGTTATLVNWGYPGTGPKVLAVLLERLLADITAAAPFIEEMSDGEPPEGLLAVTERPWPNGIVLSRADLQAALG